MKLENYLKVRLKKKLPGIIEQNKMSPIPLKNGYLKSKIILIKIYPLFQLF